MPSKKPRARTTLSEEQKREVIDLAVAAGIRAYRSEATKHQKEIYDKRLHNTKLLMRNYRSLKEHSENAVFDAATAEDDDVNEILNLMSEWAKEEDTTIESIKKSAAKTKLIMDHVDEMLRIYKAACERSKKPEDMRRYSVLYDYYVGDEEFTLEELAERSDIVSLHCAVNDETRGMVDDALLRRMKPTAYLINTARGDLVDNDALRRQLLHLADMGFLDQDNCRAAVDLLLRSRLTEATAFLLDYCNRRWPRETAGADTDFLDAEFAL